MPNRYGKTDQQQTNSSTTIGLRNTSANTIIAQSFRANATAKLTYILVHISSRVGSPTGNIWAEIYSSGANPTAGSLLATSDMVSAATIPVNAYDPFIFSGGLQLTLNADYYFLIKSDYTINGSAYLNLSIYGAPGLPNSNAWTYNGSTWTDLGSSNTLRFSVLNNQDGGYFELESNGTGTNGAITVSDLTSYKAGVASSSTDLFSLYNLKNITVSDGETLNFMKMFVGDIPGGASPAGQRAGSITVIGGATLVHGGSSTNTNSCISMYPTSATAESKGCQLWFDMSNGKDITITNSVGSLNTNNKWTFQIVFGNVKTTNGWNSGAGRAAKVFCNYSYGSLFSTLAPGSGGANIGSVINNFVSSPFGANTAVLIALNSNAIDLPNNFRFNTADYTGVAGSSGNPTIYGGPSAKLISGGSMAIGGLQVIPCASGSGGFIPIQLNTTGGFYTNGDVYSFADNRMTQVTPTGLIFTDLNDGTVKYTVSNISSIALTDRVMIFDNNGNAVHSVSRSTYEAVRYRKPANCGIISGVPLSAMTGWYAQYSSDNTNFSTSSAAAPTITPSFGTLAADKILLGFGAGQNNTEVVGTFNKDAYANSQNDALDPQKLLTGYGPRNRGSIVNGAFDKDAYEESRNDILDPSKLLSGYSAKTRNVTYNGAAAEIIKLIRSNNHLLPLCNRGVA